jgi:hypothetical protein
MRKAIDWAFIAIITASLCMVAFMFTSCVTEPKARRFMDNHELVAADYCAVKYPVKVDSNTTVKADTAGFNELVNGLLKYSDSITNEADQRNRAISDLNKKIRQIQEDKTSEVGQGCAAIINALQEQIAAIKPVDIPTLRRSIEAKVRGEVKPCYTITKTYTVENMAARKKAELQRDQAVQTAFDTQKSLNIWRIIALCSIALNLGIGFYLYKKNNPSSKK